MAVKEMINFYNNLEADGDGDGDENIERMFFIHDIKPILQTSNSETGLSKPQKTAIPRIPMEKLN